MQNDSVCDVTSVVKVYRSPDENNEEFGEIQCGEEVEDKNLNSCDRQCRKEGFK